MKSGHWSAEKQVQWSLMAARHSSDYSPPSQATLFTILLYFSFLFLLAGIDLRGKQANIQASGWQTSKSVNKNSQASRCHSIRVWPLPAPLVSLFFFITRICAFPFGQKHNTKNREQGGGHKGASPSKVRLSPGRDLSVAKVGCFLSSDILYHHLCDRTNSISGNYVACKSYRPSESVLPETETEAETEAEGQGLVLDVY